MENLNYFLSNCKDIKVLIGNILRNKLAISITLALIVLGTIKFDDVWQTFYPPPDLVQARKYLDRYVVLGAEDDGSCAEKARKARGETERIQTLLQGIIKAHEGDSRYVSLDHIFMAMQIRAPSSYPFCNDIASGKLS